MKKAWVEYDSLHDAYVLKIWDEKKSEWKRAMDGVYTFTEGNCIHYSLLTRVLSLVKDGYSVDI